MKSAFALPLAVCLIVSGVVVSCGGSDPGDNNARQETAERELWDFANNEDGFEDDAHVEALRDEAVELSQDVIGLEPGPYASEAQHCAVARKMRPKVARLDTIIGELATLGAADTSAFFGTRLLEHARYRLTVNERDC